MNVQVFSVQFFLINKNMNDHVIVIVEGLYKVELGIIRFRWNRFSFLRFGFIDGRPPFEQTPRRIPYSHANSCIPRFFSETNSPGLHQSENDHLQRKSKKYHFCSKNTSIWESWKNGNLVSATFEKISNKNLKLVSF